MSRWYVTDGTTETDLPKQLEPESDAYLPPIEATAQRAPGGTSVYYEGDALPVAGFLTLTGGVLQAAGGASLYQALLDLNDALAVATHLVREESDGTLTWPLRVGYSHVFNTQPVAKLSNVFSLGVRLAVSSTGGPTVT